MLTKFGTCGQAVGRPIDARRLEYARRFGLGLSRPARRILNRKLLDQLDACRSDEARRLIMGRTHTFDCADEEMSA